MLYIIVGGAIAYFGVSKMEERKVDNKVQWSTDPLAIFHFVAILLGGLLVAIGTLSTL